jgi:hypothetical protein
MEKIFGVNGNDQRLLGVSTRVCVACLILFAGCRIARESSSLPSPPAHRPWWTLTITRSMVQMGRQFLSVISQKKDLLVNADGSTKGCLAPNQPDGVKRGNSIQTIPGKGWFTILRLYSPLEPFFTKEWRPSEIELVK